MALSALTRRPYAQPFVLNRMGEPSLTAALRGAWELGPTHVEWDPDGSGTRWPSFPNLIRSNYAWSGSSDPFLESERLIRSSGGTPAAPSVGSAAAFGVGPILNALDEGPIGRGEWGVYNTDATFRVGTGGGLPMRDPSRYTIELGVINGELVHSAKTLLLCQHAGGGPSITVRDSGFGGSSYSAVSMTGASGAVYTNARSLAPLFIQRDGASVVLYDFRQRATGVLTTAVPTTTLAITSMLSGWEGWLLYVRVYQRPLTEAERRGLVADPWRIWERPDDNLWTSDPAAGGPVLIPGAGSSAGSSAAVGGLFGWGRVGGAGAGAGAASSSVRAVAPVAGISSSSSAAVGGLAGRASLGALAAASSTAVGALGALAALAALAAGAGSSSASAAAWGALAGSAAGSSSATAGLTIPPTPGAGLAAGSSSAAATLAAVAPVAGSSSSSSAAVGTLAALAALAGASAGSSSASGNLWTVGVPLQGAPLALLEGSVGLTSQLAGSVGVTVALVGTLKVE